MSELILKNVKIFENPWYFFNHLCSNDFYNIQNNKGIETITLLLNIPNIDDLAKEGTFDKKVLRCIQCNSHPFLA